MVRIFFLYYNNLYERHVSLSLSAYIYIYIYTYTYKLMGLGRKSEEKGGEICQFPSVDYVFWIVGVVGDFCRVEFNQVETRPLWNIF